MLTALLSLALLSLSAQAPPSLAGIVVDSTGAPIKDAVVRVHASGVPLDEARTDAEGRFQVRGNDVRGDVSLVITAPGFAPARQPLSGGGSLLEIVLQPAPFFDAVNVTSSRTDVPKVDPTASVTVFTSSHLETTAALTLDDALKVVPGFTLFRRTTSRVSNPTAQGITLRGLGGTGSSRSLVLADGVPMNDAFGGWVYWDKLPQSALDRVEVLRGSGSDLYGADAVGGVVQILTLRPDRRSVRGVVEGGSLGTGRVSVFGGGRSQGWSYSGGGEWFTTDGYVIVASDQRGAVDTKAGSAHRSGLASVGYQTRSGWRFEASGNLFSEDRKNGTPVVVNDTSAQRGSAEAIGGLGGGLVSARVYAGTQDYDQTFSAVALDRRTEDLNRRQHIPTRVTAVGSQWVRQIGRHALLVGAEGRFIKGETQETRLAQGQILGTSNDGGTQDVGSAFAQDTFLASDRLTIVAGAHADGWHTASNNTGYDKWLGSFNPRAAFAYRLEHGLSIRGSAYGGFRAPTLNELYRGFRAGNTQTNPNEALRPERLKGADAGVLLARGLVSTRVTVFFNVLDDVISNVTLSRTPALISVQRQNSDKLRSTGVEAEADVRLGASLSVSMTGAIVDSRFKGETSLRDHRVPQVPKYNAAFSVRYVREGWVASGQIRVTGHQFEDDLNLLTLRRATVVDLYAGRTLMRGMSAFVAVENLFDNEYDVGRTPILTVGMPLAVRAGVRVGL